MADQITDQTVLGHLQRLVTEEGQIRKQNAQSDADRDRLKSLGISLDQAWDLLRQRRALREVGRDPSEAHVRPTDTVEKYLG